MSKLDSNPIFQCVSFDVEEEQKKSSQRCRTEPVAWNLITYDFQNRLFVWDNSKKKLNFVEVYRSDQPYEADVDEEERSNGFQGKVHLHAQWLDEEPYQTVDMPVKVDFTVRQIIMNRTGKALALVGEKSIVVVEVQHRHSGGNRLGLRTPVKCSKGMSVGTRLFPGGTDHALRILQVTWHPCSDTHIGVLSSDSVFRLFDLSSDSEQPEQEYYLRPRQQKGQGLGGIKSLVKPVAFAFGGDHLWDRFMVLFLFGNGSIYLLCPVVPFGSRICYKTVEELMDDVRGLGGGAGEAASAWLRAVFPGYGGYEGPSEENSPPIITGGGGAAAGGVAPILLKAHAYASLDAALRLQGPLEMLSGEDIDGFAASSLLYTVVGIDSVIAIAGKDGLVRVYGIADEVQPAWDNGQIPHLAMDKDGYLISVAMVVEPRVEVASSRTGKLYDRLCEEFSNHTTLRRASGGTAGTCGSDRYEETEGKKRRGAAIVDERFSGRANGGDDVGLGPFATAGLVRFSMLDLALPPEIMSLTPITLLLDPMISQQMYVCHGGGIDAIFLVWLPFSDGLNCISVDGCTDLPPQHLEPLLDTRPSGDEIPLPLLGVTAIVDALGESWLVAVTASGDCAVMPMKPHGVAVGGSPTPTTLQLSKNANNNSSSLGLDAAPVQSMSKDILLGPRNIPIPKVVSSGKPLTLAVSEGKFFLHERCKLLHEKYIEYANRVHFELCAHAGRLMETMEDQFSMVQDIKGKLQDQQEMAAHLNDRLQSAMQFNQQLEERTRQSSRKLQSMKRPLSAAEKEYMAQLHELQLQELELLRGSVEELLGRSERFSKQQRQMATAQEGAVGISRSGYGGYNVPDSQMRRTKVALERLTGVITTMNKQIQQIETVVAQKERLLD